jgi:hypothetical protein
MHDNRPGLALFDLTLTHVAVRDRCILRLSESFTDFFCGELGGVNIVRLASTETVARYLICGNGCPTPKDRETDGEGKGVKN